MGLGVSPSHIKKKQSFGILKFGAGGVPRRQSDSDVVYVASETRH